MNTTPPPPIALPLAGGHLFLPTMHGKPGSEPTPRRLTRADMSAAAFASIATSHGHYDLGATVRQRLEESWGLTGYERLAGMVNAGEISVAEAAQRRQAASAPIREHRRATEKAALKRAMILNAPLAEIRPSEAVRKAQALALSAVDALGVLRAAEPPAPRADLRRALATVREAQTALDRAKQGQADSRWRGFASAEGAELARGRGETVEVVEVETAVWALDESGNRITDRKGRPSLIVSTAKTLSSPDGLDSLLQDGTITPPMYAAGIAYFDAYEAADPEIGLTPPLMGRDIVSGGSSDPGGNMIVNRIAAARTLRAMESQVRHFVEASYPRRPAAAQRAGEDAIYVLQEVAGKRRKLWEVVGVTGNRWVRMKALLALALDALADRRGMQ